MEGKRQLRMGSKSTCVGIYIRNWNCNNGSSCDGPYPETLSITDYLPIEGSFIVRPGGSLRRPEEVSTFDYDTPCVVYMLRGDEKDTYQVGGLRKETDRNRLRSCFGGKGWSPGTVDTQTVQGETPCLRSLKGHFSSPTDCLTNLFHFTLWTNRRSQNGIRTGVKGLFRLSVPTKNTPHDYGLELNEERKTKVHGYY